MYEVKSFEFEREVLECIELNGEPLFNSKNVGKCLEINERTLQRYMVNLNQNQKILLKNSDMPNLAPLKLNNRGEWFLTKSGLYKLAFKSNAPKAEEFTDWVADVVLPEIERTGEYHQENTDVLTNRLLMSMAQNLEQLTGVKIEEIAITQQESYNKRLSNLMIDCSTHGMGTVKELYDELFYVFAGETGIDIPEIAALKNLKRMEYLRRNHELCKTVYEFAYRHFSNNNRQIILIPLDNNQKSLDNYVNSC